MLFWAEKDGQIAPNRPSVTAHQPKTVFPTSAIMVPQLETTIQHSLKTMIVPTAYLHSPASMNKRGVSPLIFPKPRFGLPGLLMLVLMCLSGIPAQAATVAFWKFDAANPTADASGNGNTLALNGNITFSGDVSTNATGTTNSAVFDGASYAQTVGTLNLTPYSALTIEFFAKYTAGNGLQMFYSQNNPNNTVGAFYFDTEESPASLKVSQRTRTAFETDVAPEPTDGAWHHYALTMDESGTSPVIKIYVDGYAVDAGAGNDGIQAFINDYFTVGAYPPTFAFPYQGLMGEMRVSSGILLPSQFLIGAQVSKIFINQQPHNTGVVTNSPAMFNVVATVQHGSQPLYYQWQKNGVNIAGATNSSYILPNPTLNDNSAQFDVVVSAPPATPLTSSNAILTVATSSAVAFWKFDAANPTADSSGNGNTLAFNGNITFSSDVSTNATGTTNSAVFDGASYAQTVGTLNLTPYNAITIECFTKYTPNKGLQIFYSQNNPNNVIGAFYFDTGEASGTALKLGQATGSGFETDIAPGPTDGVWHHFAVTMDESGASPVVKIYVDGYEVDTGGSSSIIQAFINDYFTVSGYPPNYAFPYQGLMGEMRVSFGILTPAQFLTGPASLQIGSANGYSVISWPQNAGEFTLQQTTNLLGAWTTVTNNPVISGFNFQVTVPRTSSAMFYRLSQ
jgi:hypothetical protein